MKTLLITPPMLQFNSPFPATPYLTGFLQGQGFSVEQRDASLDLICAILTESWLAQAIQIAPDPRHFVVKNSDAYLGHIDSAREFLQGRRQELAHRIATRRFFPQGPRFAPLKNYGLTDGAFGNLGIHDLSKHLASLFVDDVADFIRDQVDPHFEFSKYGEKLASCQPTFDPLLERLLGPETLVDAELRKITEIYLSETRPDIVGFTVPFPGNLYGALKMAQIMKSVAPQIKIVMGGGFINTELRALKEARIFDFVDAIVLDDGERALQCLIEHWMGKRAADQLLRTFIREKGQVRLISSSQEKDIPYKQTSRPVYSGLVMSRYISMFEMLNPVMRLWSDGLWNKMILAHGCYWARCTFCDTSLDYIKRYEPDRVENIIQKMKLMMAETGSRGFHFVDEAAPPNLLRALSERLIEEKMNIIWWGNIRFEKNFDAELTQLMAKAGCIAVTGGLEVASERVLKLINKGVSLETVSNTTRAFYNAGIQVHAYLMYGFPTQTVQETIDSLEVVRQLFENGCLHSAFWHRFAVTIHSPVGKDPKKFGIQLIDPNGKRGQVDAATLPTPPFAQNDVEFIDPTGVDHDQLGVGLRRALYNYMHGLLIDADVREWFDMKVPKTKIPRNFIRGALKNPTSI
ncbi:MAG: radical SAM protein [Bdellovibrionales bacterium]|nr:radical SAM protein [Bdellovibrionales bacterium]